MKKTMHRLVALILNYMSAFIIVCRMNGAFRYYAEIYVMNAEYENIYSFLVWLTYIVTFVHLILSVWNDREKKGWYYRISRVDYLFCIVCTLYLCFVCAHLLVRHVGPFSMALFPFAAYMLVMSLIMTTLVRIRDKTLASTTYLLGFFRLYPIGRPFGAMMLALMVGNLAIPFAYVGFVVNSHTTSEIRDYIANVYGFYVGDSHFDLDSTYTMINHPPTGEALDIVVSTPFFLFAVFAFGALVYFCTYLCSMAASYEKANEENVKAERFKADLITNVSHDIRTPLTSIINYVDLIKRLDVEDDTLSEYLGVLDKKSARLKVLIQDLIEASKVGTGNVKVEWETVDLGEIVGQIMGEMDAAFADKRLTFVMNPHEEEVLVEADGKHLWRVMENVFGNLAKYSMPDTRVYADISQEGDGVCLTLKNISKDPLNITADELMEQFVRGERSRSKEGNGLGLYIAKSLTESLGGTFDVSINGDLFEVSLCLRKGRVRPQT